MRSKDTKRLVMNALLLAVGAILHQITPTLGLPMEPDFSLAMLFIVIILNNGEYKTSLVAGIVTGIFTALTTKFPGGQLPNMIDKIITVQVVFLLLFIINKSGVLSKVSEMRKKVIQALIVIPIGTFVSGTTFLVSAMYIMGLPAPFLALFTTVVIPAIVINLLAGLALFRIVEKSLKRVVA